MPPTLAEVLMQITDGHVAPPAERVRSNDDDSFPAAEQLVQLAILRRARENALRARVFGEPAAVRAGLAHRRPARQARG